MKRLLALFVLLLSAPGFGQVPHALKTEREACLILPQEQICGPLVTGVARDPGGKWVVVSRVRSDELSLSLWNPRTRRSSTLWKQRLAPGESGSIRLLGTLGERPIALASTPEKTQVLLIQPLAGTVRSVIEKLPQDLYELILAPDSRQGLLMHFAATGGPAACSLLDARGGVRTISLPESCYPVVWDAQGKLILRRPAAEGTPGWFSFDPESGETTSIERPQSVSKPASEPAELRFVLAASKLTDEKKSEHRLMPLWLEDREGTRVLLSVAPELRPQGLLPTAALYLAEGALWVAPIQRVERGAFEAAAREATKKAMMANARQLDSALEQYALDNKGYPPPGADILALLCGSDRYIKSDEAFRDAKGNPLLTWSWSGDTTVGAVMGTLKSPYGTITLRYNLSPAWD